MADKFDLTHLELLYGRPPDGQEPLCLVLVHNEVNILPQFFAHYRSFGALRFLVVDDHSTDGSREYLVAQPDVTVFKPKPGSSYAEHKRAWRREPLDAFGIGRWCLVPDADEHLVWNGFEHRSFHALVSDMEIERADGLFATMVDMYADKPIAFHVSAGGRLSDEFPLFDDPRKDDLAYRLQMSRARFHRRFGTPDMITTGGMRDRLFFAGRNAHSAFGRMLLRNSMAKSRSPRGAAYLRERIICALTRTDKRRRPLNLTKLPLLRWPGGAEFNGGPHHLSRQIMLSSERAVLSHYPLTRGIDGVRYLAKRGQHAEQGRYYRVMEELGEINPVYFGTSRFEGSGSLKGFFA